MGKSGKKIKSDKINTLRKQYDAFLEDDRKRRDRNEYILGRLEEMRSPTALVKIYHKENSHIKDNCFSSRRISDYLNNPSRIETTSRTTPSDCLSNQLESSILKEISKNYILIPKLQPCLSNSYINPLTENDDTDWKSKYNILNELKKNEKESVPDKVDNFILEESHKPSLFSEEKDKQEQNKISDDVTITDTFNAPTYEFNSNKSNSNIFDKDLIDGSTKDYKFHDKPDDTIPQIELPKKHITHNIESSKNGQCSPANDNIPKTEVSQKLFTEPNSQISTNIAVNIGNNDISQETTNMEMNKSENQWDGKGDEQPNESLAANQSEHQNQEFKEEISDTEKIETRNFTENDINYSGEFQERSKDYVENESAINNIQNQYSDEARMNSDQNTNAEINELEKEQNEMFYTENSDKYDESNVETVGNAIENENYTNDQYPYYDESQQEQPYTTEINEHEESTERYDPNYEQQYAENYENVPQYDDQQYEVDNSYEAQQVPVDSTINYEEVPPSNVDNFEPLPTEHNMDISYQNQEATGYNLENENYVSQQYDTNEHQQYEKTVINDQQYAIDQEYNQMNTEQDTVKELEEVLDTEDGYINNETTTLNDNTEEATVTNVSSIKNESSLKVT
ncbi:protein PFC0760c-like isoform X2 [Vanessa cardui]|uniref:protein PFC0760c-like isoform X2 n=1 Tax=Vanessa cardui TaxID=171605 RepID=UPI001F12FDED|nr:protein PFC0760c-like isoform X2 [Vanessa cardui]